MNHHKRKVAKRRLTRDESARIVVDLIGPMRELMLVVHTHGLTWNEFIQLLSVSWKSYKNMPWSNQ